MDLNPSLVFPKVASYSGPSSLSPEPRFLSVKGVLRTNYKPFTLAFLSMDICIICFSINLLEKKTNKKTKQTKTSLFYKAYSQGIGEGPRLGHAGYLYMSL